MVDKKISLCITNWNRDTLLHESFRHVVDDPRILEVVISDDCSEARHWNKVKMICDQYPNKVKLFRNQKNLGCYFNKRQSVVEASGEWVIIFDSDNVMKSEYLNALYSLPKWESDTVYAPDFARPSFDYRHFSGIVINKSNVRKMVGQLRFDCLINTMNYVVHKEEYLAIFDGSKEPWTADTIFQNYNWLMAGNKIHVVRGMEYDHLIHSQSHYRTYVHKTGNFFKEIENKLRQL